MKHSHGAHKLQPAGTHRFRFWPLLAMTVLTLVASPLTDYLLGQYGNLVLSTLLWSAGVFSVGRSRSILFVSIALAVSAVACQWVVGRAPGDARMFVLMFHVAALLFIATIMMYVLMAVIRSTSVTLDTVLGGVCVYLLFGVMFALLYSLTDTLIPGSFTEPSTLDGHAATMRWLPEKEISAATGQTELSRSYAMFYSFTTLTTLGYGDITPRSDVARSLSIMEAVAGQLYIAVLLARLVSIGGPRLPRPAGERE